MADKAMILEYLQTSTSGPIVLKDLLRHFDATGDDVASDERPHFKRMVRELIAGGDIIELKKNRIALPGQVGLLVGHLQVHRDGFGFVVPKDKSRSDLYISRENLKDAMHGDLVVASLQRKRSGKLSDGTIVSILQRGQNRIIGTYQDRGEHGFVIPEDPRLPFKIAVDSANTLHARDKHLVVAQILCYNEQQRQPDGEIIEVLGYPNTPGMDEKIVIHTYDLPHEFPAAALDEAEQIADRISDEEIQRRTDFRDQIVFTIDGEAAKDFDDAVSIERLDTGNYRLGVHIADVGYYVKVGSAIDQEAFKRGTSVYFPDRALPMFPERLSSDMCSLRAGEDRLTLSAVMDFDPTGKMVSYELMPSIIRSKQRFTYTRVRQILKDEEPGLRTQYAEFLPALELMKDLSELLLQRRMQRGSLDFDLPEPEIILDVQGQIDNIIKAERNLAHRLIEEFMIAANEAVAAHLAWMQIPSIYRVHDKPDDAKLSHLDTFLGTMGVRLQRGAEIHSKDIQRLLTRVHGKPTEHLVNFLTLRAMKQAVYAVQNTGHFGLASTHYTHFTSPIRRYPDLTVHRILNDTWQGRGFSESAVEHRRQELASIAEHSSQRERVAMEAERDILAIKKLRFMRDKVGDVFHGVISGVAPFGLFVELREYFVEGLIHVTNLRGDHYFYHEESYCLVGERTHTRYRMGDAVTIQIAKVDVARRQMDLMLA